MAYCTTTHVNALLGITLSTATQPTLTQAGVIIDNVAGEIDSALYSIGITSPAQTATLNLLRHWNTIGAAGQCKMTRGENDADFNVAQYWLTSYTDWITKVMTDSAYKTALLAMESLTDNTLYYGNQISDGVEDENDVSFWDEGFQG